MTEITITFTAQPPLEGRALSDRFEIFVPSTGEVIFTGTDADIEAAREACIAYHLRGVPQKKSP